MKNKPPSCEVIILRSALEFLKRFRQGRFQNERGGALAGPYPHLGRVIISHVMMPSPKSKAGRSWFLPNQAETQEWVEETFHLTGGSINFLGEWHSHPAPNATPSPADHFRLQDLLRTGKQDIDFLVGVVVGTNGSIYSWIERENESAIDAISRK